VPLDSSPTLSKEESTRQQPLSNACASWNSGTAEKSTQRMPCYNSTRFFPTTIEANQPSGDSSKCVPRGSGASHPSKTVESHGDWSIAFSATKRAIAYVYPHRADELSEYEEFIIGLFAAVRPSSLHFKVLNLDKAIRVHVAKDNRLSLVSFEKFSDLSTCHLIRDSAPVSRNVWGVRPGG
jgi:hypothetical protein